jgi:hypothetical protein
VRFDRLFLKERNMKTGNKPGSNTGTSGGIFQEVRPSGKPTPNFAAVPDHKPLPPTSKPGHTWKPVHTTPDSKR